MMRSLWTAASGMSSQQFLVDTIANNLSNVNTAGYKKERLEFKSLLYETMKRADLDPANMTGQPVNLQVGHGVRPIAIARNFTQGNMEATGSNMDLMIDGNGFFMVAKSQDEVAYTRDGSFKTSSTDEGVILVTSDGYPVLSADGEHVIIPDGVDIKSVSITADGRFLYNLPNGTSEDLGFSLAIAQFSNTQGLEAIGGNLYRPTVASGEAVMEAEGNVVQSNVVQGYLEMSNVQVAEEMVKLIVAQRAYELNSKIIQSSDEMLQQANNLRR